mmetsp:Transcript_20710/g.48919  ORF Transcript_20710/g.48919 Transcript_20710/m.48919 type:complete len:92 (-) Transcript_20710:74-349(-)
MPGPGKSSTMPWFSGGSVPLLSLWWRDCSQTIEKRGISFSLMGSGRSEIIENGDCWRRSAIRLLCYEVNSHYTVIEGQIGSVPNYFQLVFR